MHTQEQIMEIIKTASINHFAKTAGVTTEDDPLLRTLGYGSLGTALGAGAGSLYKHPEYGRVPGAIGGGLTGLLLGTLLAAYKNRKNSRERAMQLFGMPPEDVEEMTDILGESGLSRVMARQIANRGRVAPSAEQSYEGYSQ